MTSSFYFVVSRLGRGTQPRVLPASPGVTACVLPAHSLSLVGDSGGESCSRRGRGKRCACGDGDVVLESKEVVSAWGSGGLRMYPALCSVILLCVQSSCGPRSLDCVRVAGLIFLWDFAARKRPRLSLRHAAASPYRDWTFLYSAGVTASCFPRDPLCGGHAGCS